MTALTRLAMVVCLALAASGRIAAPPIGWAHYVTAL